MPEAQQAKKREREREFKRMMLKESNSTKNIVIISKLKCSPKFLCNAD